jgi:hypothetical protein
LLLRPGHDSIISRPRSDLHCPEDALSRAQNSMVGFPVLRTGARCD